MRFAGEFSQSVSSTQRSPEAIEWGRATTHCSSHIRRNPASVLTRELGIGCEPQTWWLLFTIASWKDIFRLTKFAPVAQLDRASVYGTEG